MKNLKSLTLVGLLAMLGATANAQTLVAFRTGTTTGSITYNAQSYSFSSADTAEWGYSNGYPSANPTSSVVLAINDEPLNNETNKSWLGFTNLFGNGAGQIAIGSNIISATLRLTIASGATAADITLETHRVTNAANNWFGAGTTNTWRYLDKTTTGAWQSASGSGNVTYMSQASSGTAESVNIASGTPINTAVDIDVTGSLTAWAASATGDNQNMGWAMWLTSAASAQNFASPSASEGGYPPTLFVSYDAIPEPATWGLLAFSLTTLVVFRRRR